MYLTREVVKDLHYVGVDERNSTLFENIHPITNGVSYNSYLLVDDKTVLFDTVDWSVCRLFIDNIKHVLSKNSRKKLDYMVIHHMEPDHAASIGEILLHFPNTKIISNKKAFSYMEQFGFNIDSKQIVVEEGEEFSFGNHKIKFMNAPMVHWPEAMVSYEVNKGYLFSADAFGNFGALNGRLFNDEWNIERDWLDEARRYYSNIVGKFGMSVKTLFKKFDNIDINLVLPLHGPVWRSDIPYIMDKYSTWASYEPEESGVLIVYSSMYGNTELAANIVASKLIQSGVTNVELKNISQTHISELISLSFKYSHIVLAGVTYNSGLYPLMANYLHDMKALNLQNRTFGLIENGTWATTTSKQMSAMIGEMKNMTILDEVLTVKSALNRGDRDSLRLFVKQIVDAVSGTVE